MFAFDSVGTAGEWVGGVGTALAFLAAAAALWSDARARREQQPRKIYARLVESVDAAVGDPVPELVGDAVAFGAELIELRPRDGGSPTLVAKEPLHAIKVRIHNGSDEPVPYAHVDLLKERGLKLVPLPPAPFIDPGQRVDLLSFTALTEHMAIAPRVDLTFQDAAGRWWRRAERGAIERLYWWRRHGWVKSRTKVPREIRRLRRLSRN